MNEKNVAVPFFLKEYFLKNLKFQNWLNVFVGEK